MKPVRAALKTALFATVLGACSAVLGLGDLQDRPDPSSTEASTADAFTGDASQGGAGQPDAPVDGSDGSVASPPMNSCAGAGAGGGGPGISTCGPDGGESCCTSLPVTGAVYDRSNDSTFPAAVSNFRLDRFEVTVARFRRFVNAVVAPSNWTPAPGSGKHSHLNSGQGLAGTSSGYEPGWDIADNGTLPRTILDWTATLTTKDACDPAYATWTPEAGANEGRSLNCLNWFEAYAFCIWDGGFLPSEAEWDYAAAGGAEQRYYPWSNPPASTTVDCTFANIGGSAWPTTACMDAGVGLPGSLPKGDGKWGHADLGGNVFEWTLDYFANYTNSIPCNDCVDLTPEEARVMRGGSFNFPWEDTVDRGYGHPDVHEKFSGLRCARSP
jgi:formylglycine-generating enzyme required for sulfatase activity